MTEVVIVREPTVIVQAGQPGLPGPPGADGSSHISSDPGNAITTGTDGGLFCPAVTAHSFDW